MADTKMATPVMITVPADRLARVLKLADECAEDLIAEVCTRLPRSDPATVRRRNRDTLDANRVRNMVKDFQLEFPFLGELD